MSKHQTQEAPKAGDVYRTKAQSLGDSSVDLHITKVANGKVSYRTDGGKRQRTFSLKVFLSDTERVR